MTVLKPIIVAFPISGDFDTEVLQLNGLCDLEKGIDFLKVKPHITLWMGFVRNLDYVKAEHAKIFKTVSINLKTNGLTIYKGVSGDVLSVNIQNNQRLSVLQNRIHHFFEPYRVIADKYEGMSESTMRYINSFNEKSLENYDPHLTIGFSTKLFDLNTEMFQVFNPRIYLAGNNCTCMEVIDS